LPGLHWVAVMGKVLRDWRAALSSSEQFQPTSPPAAFCRPKVSLMPTGALFAITASFDPNVLPSTSAMCTSPYPETSLIEGSEELRPPLDI
jgi:hypothetical protein